MKIANMLTWYKADDDMLLPVLSKFFERIVYNRLIYFVENN